MQSSPALCHPCPTAWAGGSSAANSPPHRRPAPRWSSAAAPVCRRDVPVPFRIPRTGRRCPPAASGSPAFSCSHRWSNSRYRRFSCFSAANCHVQRLLRHIRMQDAGIQPQSRVAPPDGHGIKVKGRTRPAGIVAAALLAERQELSPHGQSAPRNPLHLFPPSFHGYGIGTPSQTPPRLNADSIAHGMIFVISRHGQRRSVLWSVLSDAAAPATCAAPLRRPTLCPPRCQRAACPCHRPPAPRPQGR